MKKIVPVLLLAALVFAAYAPALRNGFVWDDTALVLRDPLIRSWRLIPEGFQHFLFTDATASDFYRPIQRLVYTLEYGVFAVRPLPYHLTSILCHLGAAFALLLLAEELLRTFGAENRARRIAALVATLAWALHPMHNAAVVYVAGLADPLAALFGFLGFYLALRSEREAKRWTWLLAATALFLTSALSKESGLIFPVLWLAVLLLQKNRQGLVRWAGVAAVVVVIYLSLRLPADHIPPPGLRAPAPLLVRPIVAARAVAEYAQLMVAPIHLYMERDVETRRTGLNEQSARSAAWRELETLLGIVLLAALVFWAVRARQRESPVFELLILAALAYLPISGLLILNAAIAEHWLYLPSAFLFLAGGVEMSRLSQRPVAWKFSAALLGIWICFLGARTFLRTFDWKDQRILFQRTIAAGGNSTRMLINLAGVEMNEGELAPAKAHLLAALAKDPEQPLAFVNLAAVAIKQGDYKAAHEWIDRAEKMPFVEATAYELHTILENKELGKTNLLRMRLASRTGPSNWPIEKRYIKVLDEAGANTNAIAELQTLLQQEWYRAESWQLLGELLAKAGRTSEAAAALQRAHDYDVHLSLRPKAL